MNDEFKRQLDYCNVTAWHEAGYKGNGITVFMDDTTVGNHNELTKSVVEAILPEATVLTGTVGLTIASGRVTSAVISCNETNEQMPFETFVAAHNIDIINNSKDGGTHDEDSPKAVWLREMRSAYNLILTASAGNGYGQPCNNSYYGAGIIVTGVNSKKKSTYAEDDVIDFAAFTADMAGTSFAAPFFAGMAGLLRCINPEITQTGVCEYFRNNCEDLGVSGKDPVYGYGLVKMGEVAAPVQPTTEEPRRHWAEVHLDSLTAKGIINSPELHRSKLNEPLSRGELFAIIDRITD